MKYLFGFLAIVVVVYLAFTINSKGLITLNQKNIELSPTQTIVQSVKPTTYSTQVPIVSIDEELKKLFVNKYRWDINKIELMVSKSEGDYAKGSVRMTDEMGGGMWFAAKVNNEWKLVFDGNGIITCAQLKDYPNFPVSLIPECFDEKTNKLVNR